MLSSASRLTAGLAFAVVSACSFGLSGSMARSLLDTGWTAGAAVTLRITIGAVALMIPAAVAMRGRWTALREPRVIGSLTGYGILAVAVPQLCYFYAVQTLQVGVALLIEYTAPVVVIAWMWIRHRQRPTLLTFVGAVVAAAGLTLVLQIFGSVSLDAAGVAWALGAMVGAAGYFVMSGNSASEIPGIAMAAGGLLSAAVMLGLSGAVGVLPMSMSTDDVQLAGNTTPWWVPMAILGLVTAALAYATGIAATRRLGPRLASFVALAEVLAAIVAAWMFLGEVPAAIQLAGGALIVAGVVVVKLGERPGEPESVPV
ncbi:EamA family transporter [Gordonia sp. PDNC005]|uniref:EamA family transporter n=1 Tax=Gordonia sp. PDNC005 TaxID=2811424 RepID=UPI001965FE82|nr:EamA family transporter [Gordonia sp. PDNC005]QRY61623.1 EamA family transporter [Gordonia sp. PDNC005]